jgi:hypothetical protein
MNNIIDEHEVDSSSPCNDLENSWSFIFIIIFTFMEFRFRTGVNVPHFQKGEQNITSFSYIYIYI